MPVDLGDYSALPDVESKADLGDYAALPDAKKAAADLGDYATLPDIPKPSPTPEINKALSGTAIAASRMPAISFLPKSGTQTDTLEGREVIRDPAIQKPLNSVADTAKGFVTGIPDFLHMAADPWSPDTLHKLLGGGLQTAAQLKQIQTSQPFSQEWWNGVVPITANLLGEIGGVRGSAPALEKPPIQDVRPVPEVGEAPTESVLPKEPVGVTETLAELKKRNAVTPGEVISSEKVKGGMETQGPGQEEVRQVESPLASTAAAAVSVPESAPAAEPPSPVQHGEFQQEGYTAVPVHDEPVVSAVANKYTQERMATGDLGSITPGEGASVQDLATRGQKIVEQQGEGIVDQSVSRVMSGTFDPVNDAAVVRFQEARLKARKDAAYRELQANPDNIEKQQSYENAFKDLTDFHQGPIATVKSNWAQAGRGLQGSFPVDLTTADGLREAWLQNTGKDAPESVRPVMEKVADRVRYSIDTENGVKTKLSGAIEKAFNERKSKITHDQIRDRFLKELEERPCL
jgi:hypothetical protein